MVLSNSTAKNRSHGETTGHVEGAGITDQGARISAQSGIRHKTQFCAQTRIRYKKRLATRLRRGKSRNV